jgi:hypothetical protein
MPVWPLHKDSRKRNYHNLIIFYILPLIPYSYGFEVIFILWIYSQSVGLLGRVLGPSQGLYLNTGQHKHRKTHKYTHTPNIHARSGFEPTITESERAKTVHALDRSATVTGATI